MLQVMEGGDRDEAQVLRGQLGHGHQMQRGVYSHVSAVTQGAAASRLIHERLMGRADVTPPQPPPAAPVASGSIGAPTTSSPPTTPPPPPSSPPPPSPAPEQPSPSAPSSPGGASQHEEMPVEYATPPRQVRRTHGRRRWTEEGRRYIIRMPLIHETQAWVQTYLKQHPEAVAVLKIHNQVSPGPDLVGLARLVIEARRAHRRTLARHAQETEDCLLSDED